MLYRTLGWMDGEGGTEEWVEGAKERMRKGGRRGREGVRDGGRKLVGKREKE